VSLFPSIVTVTVTVKGEPAVEVDGAVKLRIACGVPQPNVTDIAIAAVKAHSAGADGGFTASSRWDLSGNLRCEICIPDSVHTSFPSGLWLRGAGADVAVALIAELDV
jgi:hypothetical protein